MPTSASLLSTYFVSVFQGFSFSLSFRAARMKNVLACLIASGISSVSQSLSLFVCLAAAAAQAPSLNVLRCCSRVAKKMAQRRIRIRLRLRLRIRSHLVIFHALKSRLPSVSRERFSTLVKVIIDSCLARSHSLSLPLALTQQVEQRAHARARLRLLS